MTLVELMYEAETRDKSDHKPFNLVTPTGPKRCRWLGLFEVEGLGGFLTVRDYAGWEVRPTPSPGEGSP